MADTSPKRGSRVRDAAARLNGRFKPSVAESDSKALDSAFEAVLSARNIPENMRQQMRSLDKNVKADLIKHENATLQVGDASSGSRDSTKRLQQGDPARRIADGIDETKQKLEVVEVRKLHKLRLLLRSESVAWVDEFLGLGGLSALIGLLHRIMAVEWREEHEDLLLHEVLLCMKGLCTTDKALEQLSDVAPSLFPELLHMIFDEERKGPSEFSTRGSIVLILCDSSPSQL
ncbi:hypothetical protein MRB53_037593 [Persea americana]|nr:hypothetical protein MRB53_037593 [Persea americana]